MMDRGHGHGFVRDLILSQHCFHKGLLTFLLGAFALVLLTPVAHAQLQLGWRIGVDDDPLESGYDATHEFSQENFVNDLRPGKVTRIPGDPLYSPANNPLADDDFYCAGTYPIGFNGLTTSRPVAFN